MGRLIRRMIQKKWDGNTQRDAIRLASQTPPQGGGGVGGPAL